MALQAGAHAAPASAFRDWYAHWDDGTAPMMLTPGSSGYGLMVWNMPLYGCREENYEASALSGGFLTVVPCAWSCAYGNDGYLTDTIVEAFTWGGDDDLVAHPTDLFMTELTAAVPHVLVRGLRYPDDDWGMYTTHGNVLVYNEDERRGYTPSLAGLAPLWTVVPVDRAYYQQWSRDLIDMWSEHADSLAHTQTSICGHALDGHDCVADECGDEECLLDEAVTMAHELARNGFEMDIEHYMTDPEVFMDVHEYALHRYRQGWRTAILRSLNGDECSSSFSQVCSPWRVSASSLDSLQPPERQRSIA